MSLNTITQRDPLEKLRSILPYLVDSKVGIIRELNNVKTSEGDPEFFHFSSTACNTEAFVREKNFRDAGGASTNREIAMAKAVGEAVERYSAAIFDFEELPLSSYNEATFPCVAPADFNFFSKEQYEAPGFMWVPFNNDTTVRWTKSINILNGEARYLPAATVYIPYMYYQGTGDSPIVQPISTGLACHSTYEDAAVGAICEVIERDAFMIMWQARLAMPQIRIETLSDANFDKVMRFERNGSKVILFNITMEHDIPCILAVLKGTSAISPARVFAASADIDPEKAVAKALEELAHTRRYCYQLKKRMKPLVPDFPEHENIESQVEHLLFYTDYENAKLADYIFESKKRIDFCDIPNYATGNAAEDLEIIKEHIAATGENIYISDLTTEDVRDLGLHVLRAVIPGFQPLRMGFKMRSLGGKRLWTIPQQLGYKGVSQTDGDNPLPHPYP